MKDYLLKKKIEIKTLLKKKSPKKVSLIKYKKNVKRTFESSLRFIYKLVKNIGINGEMAKFVKSNKKLKKLNLNLYKKKLNKIENRITKANHNFFKDYYYMYNKQILKKKEHSRILKHLFSKSKKRRKLSYKFLINENTKVSYVFKISLLKSIIFFMFSKKTSDSLFFSYIIKSMYFKTGFNIFYRMFTKFLRNQDQLNSDLLKNNIIQKFSKKKLDKKFYIHSFLKNSILEDFLFKFIDKKYHSVAHKISLAPWGVSDEEVDFSNHNKTVFMEVAKYRMPLQQYLYTKSKIIGNLRWSIRRYKHFYNKKLLWSIKKRLTKVRSRRRNWFPLYKLGKFWQRFRKKPYNWVSNDWKNKFFRMVKRPFTNYPTALTRDVEKGIIYRSRNLKSNRFRTKFIIKRYLKKKFFSNKLSAVNQFLKSKYKKKKCTFWEKTYQHLFGRMDVMLCWYGFAPSLRKARRLLKLKHVYVEGKCVTDWKAVLNPEDMIYVKNMGTFFNNKTLSTFDYPAFLIRKFKKKLMLKLSKSLVYKVGFEWNFKNRLYSWWKSFIKNLRIFKKPRDGIVPNWVSVFLEKYGYNVLGNRNLNSSRLIQILNKIYFSRERKFLYQRLVPNLSTFNLKNRASLDYFLTDMGARSLIIGEDRVRNREERKKNKNFKSIEEILATYSDYLTPLDENLLQNRYNSIIYKSTTAVRGIEDFRISSSNYFKLSKFENGNYNLSRDIYMFFLSRVFY